MDLIEVGVQEQSARSPPNTPFFAILTQTQIPALPAIMAMVKLDQHFWGTRKSWRSWQQVLCKCHKSPAYVETVQQLQAALQSFFVNREQQGSAVHSKIKTKKLTLSTAKAAIINIVIPNMHLHAKTQNG